jgi:hypothetical protein
MKATIAIFTASLLALTLIARAQDEKPAKDTEDKDIAADWKLLQGTWELIHGSDGKGRPTIRTLKTIEGNKETLRRYAIDTGKMMREHSVELQLTKSGSVRVCTFYGVGGSPDDGMSFVYKVDEENFWDIPGILQGDEYRNYQKDPTVWHWKRVVEAADKPDAENNDKKE